MGGHIEVESAVGEGSRFRFEIPLDAADTGGDDDTSARAGASSTAPGARRRVLVVEDNLMNRKIAVRMLERMGHVVTTAEHGGVALERLAQQSFDLVLLDMQMPVLDGLATARAVRASAEPWSSVPIVAMTANAMQRDRERCLDAGMDGFLSKPFRFEVLREIVDSYGGSACGADDDGARIEQLV
jgi:CheY-like chemotaxis protein